VTEGKIQLMTAAGSFESRFECVTFRIGSRTLINSVFRYHSIAHGNRNGIFHFRTPSARTCTETRL